MNMIIPLLASTAILFFVLFITLVLLMTTRSNRTKVRHDMRRIKSQITREMPDAEW